jgi:hypothetical protein
MPRNRTGRSKPNYYNPKTEDPTRHTKQTEETAMHENPTTSVYQAANDELDRRWPRHQPTKHFVLLMAGLFILLLLLYALIVCSK